MRRDGKPHIYLGGYGGKQWRCTDIHYFPGPHWTVRDGYSPLDAYKQWEAAREVLITASQRDLKDMPSSRPMATVVHIGTRLDQSGQSLSDLQVME